MTNTHTPGPWVIDEQDLLAVVDDNGNGWVSQEFIIKPKGAQNYIASVTFRSCSPDDHGPFPNKNQAKANADLIASAPSPLEALEKLLEATRGLAEIGCPVVEARLNANLVLNAARGIVK